MSDNGYFIPNLKDYDISEEVGFLLPNPLSTLPPYFKPWETLAKGLEGYLEKRLVRQMVIEMPFLEKYEDEMSADPEIRHKQLCLAYVFLTFIGSAFVWQEGESGIERVIPKQLAVPWFDISKRLGLRPVPCMASVALNNYQLKDNTKPISLENLEVICSVPKASWFFLVTIQVEVDAVEGIKAILKAKQAVLNGDDKTLKSSLGDLAACIEKITETSLKMFDNLKPDDFFNVVRPYISGYGGKGSKIPEGLIFEGVSEELKEAIGGSAAQSSTIQSFDAALGIKHDSNDQKYLDKVREYMPPKHRKFIEKLGENPSIKNYVKESQDMELKNSHKKAIDALFEFRDRHSDLVNSFILKEAAKSHPGNAAEQRGTGGTALVEFLEGTKRSTKKAKEEVD